MAMSFEEDMDISYLKTREYKYEFIKEYVKELFIDMIVCKNFCNMYLKFKKSVNPCKYELINKYFEKVIKGDNVDNIELYDCIFNVVRDEYMKLFKKILDDKVFNCLCIKYMFFNFYLEQNDKKMKK